MLSRSGPAPRARPSTRRRRFEGRRRWLEVPSRALPRTALCTLASRTDRCARRARHTDSGCRRLRDPSARRCLRAGPRSAPDPSRTPPSSPPVEKKYLSRPCTTASLSCPATSLPWVRRTGSSPSSASAGAGVCAPAAALAQPDAQEDADRPERDERVHRSRAPRRKETGDKRDDEEHERHDDEGRHVGRLDAEEQVRDELRERQRADDAERDADRDHPDALSQDHAQHFAALSAERHPDAELLHALADRERHDAADPDRRDRQRERGEDGDERRREPRRRQRRRAYLFERPEPIDRLLGIDLAKRRPHLLRHRRGIDGGSDEPCRRELPRLQDRSVDCLSGFLCRARCARLRRRRRPSPTAGRR